MKETAVSWTSRSRRESATLPGAVGGAFVDYDHDGDLDLLVTNLTDRPGSLLPGDPVSP